MEKGESLRLADNLMKQYSKLPIEQEKLRQLLLENGINPTDADPSVICGVLQGADPLYLTADREVLADVLIEVGCPHDIVVGTYFELRERDLALKKLFESM